MDTGSGIADDVDKNLNFINASTLNTIPQKPDGVGRVVRDSDCATTECNSVDDEKYHREHDQCRAVEARQNERSATSIAEANTAVLAAF